MIRTLAAILALSCTALPAHAAPGAANGQDFVDITVTVNPQFDLFFIEVEPITLSETRRVYRPA